MKRVKSILGFILLVILLTSVVDIIMFSTNYLPILNRMETSLFDWDIQDIVYSTDNFKDSDTKFDEIVLVNFEHIDRDSIALLIELLKLNSPKVIGINAIFSEPRDSIKDNKLRVALQDCDLVAPIYLKKWNDQKKIFTEATGTHNAFLTPRTTKAFTYFYSYDPMRDLYGTDDDAFIRTFSPSEKLNDSTVFCFGIELVKRYDEKIFRDYLNKVGLSNNEQLRYWGDTSIFKTLGYKVQGNNQKRIQTQRHKGENSHLDFSWI